MAKISVEEIRRTLARKPGGDDASFIEIRFDDAERASTTIDPQMKDRVITAECSYGSVTILFNERGLLSAVEIS
jgi:hypothetical protein